VVERVVAFLGRLVDQAEWRWLKVPRVLSCPAGAPEALGQERAEGERLGRGPVEALAGLEHLLLGLEQPLRRSCAGRNPRMHAGQRLADIASVSAEIRSAALVFFPLRGSDATSARPASRPCWAVVLAGLELLVQMGLERGLHVLDLALGDQAVATRRSV
jgi:hypothetical protein